MDAEDDTPLWQLPEEKGHDPALVKATKASLRRLQDAERLPPERAALAELCIALASSIDKGARSGRASAVAMAAAQLRETMLVLDPPPEDGDAAAEAARRLEEFMARLEDAAAAGVTELRAVQ